MVAVTLETVGTQRHHRAVAQYQGDHEAESLIDKSASSLRDQVVLSCALGNEHYEMSAYQGLIIPITAMGAGDVLALLQANLDQEVHTSKELEAMLRTVVG